MNYDWPVTLGTSVKHQIHKQQITNKHHQAS